MEQNNLQQDQNEALPEEDAVILGSDGPIRASSHRTLNMSTDKVKILPQSLHAQ